MKSALIKYLQNGQKIWYKAEKNDWGTLVPGINVKNVIKLGLVLKK
jgi:hypothetical protein